MHVIIITSWPTDVMAGSGTAVFFNSVVDGLRQRAYDVEIIAPNFDSSDYVHGTLQRFLFNTQLRTDPRIPRADVVIGFDYDGYGLDPATRPPMISSALAVYGDVIQWEEEPYRTMVASQAFFDQVAMQQADAVTIGSNYAKRRVSDLYQVEPDKITVIPYGEQMPAWMPLVEREKRQPNDHPIILSVGKMFPRKRTDILLHAAALLLPKYPTLELRMAGDGINFANLRRIADEIGITPNVTWLGHVAESQQFAHEWRQADIFCHPSSQETFGYVYLEAMRVGLPIVAVAAGAAPEVLGDAARLSEPENPEALAVDLDYFLSHPETYESYSKQAKQRAQHYTIERMIDGYDAVINQVVSNRVYKVS
jgi:glycosyltransferase involved in cell wall biosynthesis